MNDSKPKNLDPDPLVNGSGVKWSGVESSDSAWMFGQATVSYALVDPDEVAESGTCALCGQELLQTATDCWHPYTVERACPPEPGDDWSPETGWPAFYRQYRSPGRPGREHFIGSQP